MANIIEEILKLIPDKVKISDTSFEGANIILYTKDANFFLNNQGTIKGIVDTIKKRIELRPDPAITMDVEKAEKKIKEILPKESGIGNILFDPQRSRVIIEVEKPGVAIGKDGELLREIRKQCLWVPVVRRLPALRSKIIENIRAVLYQHSDERRKFLDKVGHRIYDGWMRTKKEEWIRLTYLGGARQVGRSCLFLQTPESRILLDCGVNVAASDQNAYPYLDAPEFKIEDLDAIIISHAHLDHCGIVPFLFKMGYRGPVYMTAPTRDIAALLALDYISVAFKQAKSGIFDVNDVKEMVKHTICLDYGEVSDITPDIRITFYNAGHILGSSLVHLHVGNGLHNLVYTGDLKCINTRLLDAADTRFPRLETLMIESTYGGKDNILKPRLEAEATVIQAAKETLEAGGKVLIPVLGVGRAQELILIMNEAMETGKVPHCPIYAQGMVWDVTAIHTAYPDFLGRDLRKEIFHNEKNPFLSPNLRRVGSKKEQDEVIKQDSPCIIIATSGMLTGGPSVEYFKQLCDDEKNTLIFVSYVGEGTLGRRIQEGERKITLTDNEKPETLNVKMRVHIESSLSGHAGRTELMRYISNLQPRPKKVIVNHGEQSRCLDLASSIHKANRIETEAPKNLETIRIR
ncbi:MAG: beta-CASP ribonuclease aCPSF1 [Nanoarchaeota archaeon]|nr:beta-CASP ribonuclease aCPSF1 [Nanoarchaeota archaeon]